MAAEKPFAGVQLFRESPATRAYVPVQSNTDELTVVTRALWVGNGGDVKGVLEGDTDAVVFPNVQSGTLLPFSFKQIFVTGTDASDLVAVY